MVHYLMQQTHYGCVYGHLSKMKSNFKPLATIVISAALLAVLLVWVGSYRNDGTSSSQTSPQIADQKIPKSSKGQQWLSAPKAAPPADKPERTFRNADGVRVGLSGLTVSQYVKTLYDAANKGDIKAAYNIYGAEEICERMGAMQRNLRYLSPANHPAFLASIQSSIDVAQTVCADFNGSQRERLYYLLVAVKGGLPGAATVFASEPPEGFDKYDPQSIDPADPRVIQWQKEAIGYLTQAAEQGDISAMGRLAGFYFNGQMAPQNVQLALTYELAWAKLRNENLDRPIITEAAAKLTPDQVSAATEAANQLINSCCNKH